MSKLKNTLSAFVLGTSLLSAMPTAMAQAFPSKPLTLICPYAAGGLTDVLSRLIAKRLGERLGQTVVVENRAGGGGIIAVETAAAAAPDGYTLLLVGQGLASVNASLHKNLRYDTLRDFAPVSQISTFSMVFVGHPQNPPKTFAEWIAMAKAKPGALNYGSAGNASTAHLMTELLKEQVGIDVRHIPFRGESAAFQELMAGRLDGMFATVGGSLPLIQSGKLKALAVATKERSKLLPDVPTVSEAGVPNFEVLGWYGIVVPAKVPKPIVDKLHAEFAAMSREPEFRDQIQARGMDVVSGTSDDLRKLIASETNRWRDVVNKAGITAE